MSDERAARPRISQVRAASFVQFLATLKPDTKMSRGRPLKATIAPHWFFPMRYVLRGPDGRPTAFVSATMPVEVLEKFWSDSPVVGQPSLGLMREDGVLISLFPTPAGATQDMIYGIQQTGLKLGSGAGGERAGYVEGDSPILGRPGGNAWQRLDHDPITMFVATPRPCTVPCGGRRCACPPP